MQKQIIGKDVIEYLSNLSNKENERDFILNGNPNRIIKKVATVFLLTVEVLKKCIEDNVDMIIVHEGLFYHQPAYIDKLKDEIAIKKNNLLKKSDILVYRFHDAAHNVFPDIILDGFLSEIDLGITANDCVSISFGERSATLEKPLSIKYIVSEIKRKLNLKKVRFFGNKSNKVDCIHFGLGQCLTDYEALSQTNCNLYICGEVYDLPGGSYCADAKALGYNKNIIAIGHYSSEYLGMKYFAKFLSKKFSSLQIDYIDCGEFFSFI